MNMQRKAWPATIKAADGARRYRFKISTGSPDRERDTIDPNGWRLDEYKKNPIVLWSHDRMTPPIAKTVDIRVVGNSLQATCEFPPPGVYPLADQIRGLIDAGVLSTASVGFLPDRKEFNAHRSGFDIKEATLLEWSVVNIPANAEATIQRCIGAGCDTKGFDTWLKGSCVGDDDILAGIKYAEGDVLQLDDEHNVIDWPLPVVNAITKRTVQRAMQGTISKSVRQALLYHRGRVD